MQFWGIVRELRRCQADEKDFLASFQCRHIPDEDLASGDRCCTFRYKRDGSIRIELLPGAISAFVRCEEKYDSQPKMLAEQALSVFISELNVKLKKPVNVIFKNANASLSVSDADAQPSAFDRYDMIRARLRGEHINTRWCCPGEEYEIKSSNSAVVTAYAGYNSENSLRDMHLHWLLRDNSAGIDTTATICTDTVKRGERIFHEFQRPVTLISASQSVIASVEGKYSSGSLQAGIMYKSDEE